ncbi:MarR family winged helix-turn-helix transcriptional regulator [Nocardioides dongkuii]|uniref:MarR family winged helix-turn-helix transcriptional regulator n=1 Tax=Nocardioides dongkuii TaxID=2760089 RepID=UPI0015F86638|nr:MarR family transcriptional regulator [Nocardioides dongkuii]
MTVIEPEGTPISVGVLLFIPYRHLEQRILAAVNEAGFAITLPQARLVQRLDPAGSRLTDLAAAAQVSKQAAGYLVDELERARFVTRTPDPDDRRARLIVIAERGRAAAAVALREQQRAEGEWEAHVGAERMAELRRILEDLRTITDPWR